MRKEIYLSENLLVDIIIYDYEELKKPMKNLKNYYPFKEETKSGIYYQEDEEDNYNRYYTIENIENAYEQTETIFDVISTLETANEIEYYLYGELGENIKVYNIYNDYMKAREEEAKEKTFWEVLFSLC
jgi:hypothetical protein